MLTEYKPIILLIITAMAFLCACGAGSGGQSDARNLTVSLEPQRYLLEKIAGPDWTVTALLGRGEDPENFDPSISDLKKLHDSKVYFKTGTLEFEKQLESRMPDGIRFYDTSVGIDVITGTHGNCRHHDHNIAGHDHEGDPHTWTSVRNAKIMSRNMLSAMIEISPSDSAVFRENYRRLIAELDSCDSVIASLLEPLKGKAFMVWHPSLSYFARDYGLRQLSMGMDNKEMSARDFKRRIDMVRSEDALVFLVQPDFDTGRSEAIASAAGNRSATINTLVYDMPAELLRISQIISRQK